MEEVKFTERELEVLEKYFKDEISMFGTSNEDMETMTIIIDRAQALLMKTKEDIGDDLIKWYYGKYNPLNEEGNAERKKRD